MSEIRARFPLMGLTNVTISQTADTETTDIPDFTDRVVRVRDPENLTDEKLPVDFFSRMASGFALTDSQFYWVRDDRTNDWQLQRTRIPWEVHYGDASTFNATTITLATTPTGGNAWVGDAYDDYYNDAYIYVQNATTNKGQKAKITDYAGATGVATIAAWPGGLPTGTLTYEIMPMIDAVEFKNLLAWEVALRIQNIARGEVLQFERKHPYTRQHKRLEKKWTRFQQRMAPMTKMTSFDQQG